MASLRKVVHRTGRYHPDKRIIRIERSLAEVRGHLRFGPPKTAAARRAVSIPSWLPDVIDQHIDDHPAGSDGLIFTAPEGGPIRRNAFRGRFWLPAVADSIGQPMRFHDLRHSHVALLIADTLNPPWDPSDVDALWSRRTRNTDQGRELT